MALTHQRLCEILSYDEASGHFFWLNPTSNRVKRGDCAGTLGLNGYIYIGLDKKLYLAHRLAVFYMTGEMPSGLIDHINIVSTDNRYANLRHASYRLNAENKQTAQSNNKLGILGVTRKHNKFKAQIQVHGKNRYIGSFSTPEAAHEAYLVAKRSFHEGNML